MSILSRICTILSANINDLLDRAENPEKMLNQYVLDMEEAYKEARGGVVAAIAEKNLLESKYNEAVSEFKEWEKKAALAVEKGQDDLALKALKRQQNAEEDANSLKTSLDAQSKACEDLKDNLSLLEDKISEVKNKKEVLIARAKNVQAAKKVQDTMGRVGSKLNTEGFDKMEEKVNRLEAEAKAQEELNGLDLDAKFKALEDDKDSDKKLHDKLAELKSKLGK